MRATLCLTSFIFLGVLACDDKDSPSPIPQKPLSAVAEPSASNTPPTATATATTSAAGPATPKAPGKPAAKAQRTYKKLDEAAVKREVTPHLSGDHKLAHPAFRGPLGPSKDAVIAITQKDTTFGALVVADGKKHELEKLHDSWAAGNVLAITYSAKGDDDDEDEALVIATYSTGIGPDAAKEFKFVSVIDWNGSEASRNKAAEGLLLTARNSAEARKMLAAPRFPMKIKEHVMYVAPHLEADAVVTRLGECSEGRELSVKTDERIQLDYEDVTYVFDFEKTKLTRVLMDAHTKDQNATARELSAWLDAIEKGKAEKDGAKLWSIPGWKFKLVEGGQGDDSTFAMTATPTK